MIYCFNFFLDFLAIVMAESFPLLAFPKYNRLLSFYIETFFCCCKERFNEEFCFLHRCAVAFSDQIFR